jgi:heme/copper-type cytochrome/quinol oxidase subunit 2
VIEIIADKDSRYKVEGERSPVVRLSAGEKINLRITAHRGTRWNQDGSVHGFAMVRKNGTYVPGWKFLLKEGLNEFHLVAPKQLGDYIVICTVVCGRAHEHMNMKIVVVPSRLGGVSRNSEESAHG